MSRCVGFFVILVLAWMPAQALEVQEVKADGLHAWLIEDTSLPIFSLQMEIRNSGSAYDPKGREGLAHLTAAMLTEGAGDYRDGAFQEELDFYAIDLSVSAGRDALVIRMEALSEHRDKAFELLGLMLMQPRFDVPDMQRIRAEHLATLERLWERPSHRLSTRFYQEAFPGHPYGRPSLGTDESITAITRDDMQTFMESVIAKNRFIVSVAGDVNAETLSGLLAQYLGNVPELVIVEGDAVVGNADLHMRPQPIIEKMVTPQTPVRIVMQGIGRSDEDFYAAFVLNHIVGGGSLSSRLGKAVRKEQGLTYAIGSDLAILDHAHWFSIDFSTKNASAQQAIQIVHDTLDAIVNDGISENALQEAQRYLTGAFPLNTDSNTELVRYLNVMQRYQLGKDYLEKRNEYINGVTHAQINVVARRLFDTKEELIIMTGEYDE